MYGFHWKEKGKIEYLKNNVLNMWICEPLYDTIFNRIFNRIEDITQNQWEGTDLHLPGISIKASMHYLIQSYWIFLSDTNI